LAGKTEILRDLSAKLGVWSPIIYLAGFVLRPVVFFPSVPYAILGGIIFGKFLGPAYVLAGAMLSGVIEFILARYFFGDLARRALKDRFKLADRLISENGFMAVLLIRLVPNVAFDLQNIILALAPVRFRHFAAGTLLGCLPASIFYASIGSAVFTKPIAWQIWVIAGAGITLVVLKLIFTVKQGSDPKIQT
jgi:uncharacterized membrane protein YdjX (TVP38/TMEM64 family)